MTRTGYIAAALVAAIVIAVAAAIALSGGGDDGEWTTVDMLVEYSEQDGAPIPHDEQPSRGTVRARRLPDRIEAEVDMRGLIPGGVYSFWLAVWQEVDEPSTAAFLASGGGAVADEDGVITSGRMSATVGTMATAGWVLDGVEQVFAPLHSPLQNTMRVEVVYHGQADKAGDQLDLWLNDFWTGDPEVCAEPVGTLGTGIVPSLPYCAGYYGATIPESDGPSNA